METHNMLLIGLSLEIVGLVLLFYDLIKSKALTDKIDEVRQAREELEAETRELSLRTMRALAGLGDFVSAYLSASEAVDGAKGDEERETLRDLKGAVVQRYTAIQADLSAAIDTDAALTRNEEIRSRIEGRYKEQGVIAFHLKLTAIFGILFVLAGALTQLFVLVG